MKAITYEQALHRLAAFCSRGEKCIYDIRQKMTCWELPENEQEKIINYLQKEKFLDEKRFCRAFVNDKIKYNHWGIHKIRYELKKKQIDNQIINEYLQNIDLEENKKQLQLLLKNKLKTIKGKNDYEIKQKLIRFAVGRGFPLEEIENVLR
jgi:regulatory protein